VVCIPLDCRTDPAKLDSHAQAHPAAKAYRYYPDGKHDRFSGEAVPLTTMLSSVPRKPLLRLFQPLNPDA
jgi:hypothetical protein